MLDRPRLHLLKGGLTVTTQSGQRWLGITAHGLPSWGDKAHDDVRIGRCVQSSLPVVLVV